MHRVALCHGLRVVCGEGVGEGGGRGRVKKHADQFKGANVGGVVKVADGMLDQGGV